MSRRAAAARYDVYPSTAINLGRRHIETGEVSAKPQGGDRRSGRAEAHAPAILALVADQPDITLAEIVGNIFETTGERFGVTTNWRLLKSKAPARLSIAHIFGLLDKLSGLRGRIAA